MAATVTAVAAAAPTVTSTSSTPVVERYDPGFEVLLNESGQALLTESGDELTVEG